MFDTLFTVIVAALSVAKIKRNIGTAK